MRTGLLLVLGLWLSAVAPILAQSTPPPVPPYTAVLANPANPDTPVLNTPVLNTPVLDAPVLNTPVLNTPVLDAPVLDAPVRQPDSYHYWVRAEYLALWVKSAPLPVSLVTGDAANPTQELLDSDRSLGIFSGFRVGVGAWFDSCNTIGWDGNFFDMQQRMSTFSASSNAAGSPTLAFPFTSQTPGAVGNSFIPIAVPGALAGSVQAASTLKLWGAETNGVLCLMHEGGFDIVALAGFRYVDLRESLDIGAVSSDILTVPNTVLSQNDWFGTRNQFYGGQVGSRITWQSDHFGLDLTGKLAIGATHETVDIQGVSTLTGTGGVVDTYARGLFAQPSNIGQKSANQFSVIPSVEMKFSWFITSHLSAFVGYDFLYWTDVVRPGNQVDHNINLAQSTAAGGPLSGPADPTPLFKSSDFWAQGLTVGLELRF